MGLRPTSPVVVSGETGAQDRRVPSGVQIAAFAAFVPILPTSPRFAENPELLARLLQTPHGYFRFINIPFSQAICRRYADRMQAMPTVNLHGDAHVEQYTVTEFGVGLSDFDDSSFGPAVIDLLRFATSLRLAAREREWPNAFEPAVAAFLDGYRSGFAFSGLRSSGDAGCGSCADHICPRPQCVSRRGDLADALGRFRRGLLMRNTRGTARLMESEHPDLRAGYFDLKNFGRFQVGSRECP